MILICLVLNNSLFSDYNKMEFYLKFVMRKFFNLSICVFFLILSLPHYAALMIQKNSSCSVLKTKNIKSLMIRIKSRKFHILL